MIRSLVTVKDLTNQARQNGSVRIDAGALITPAAQDWLRSAAVPVHRMDGAEEGPAPRGPLVVAPDRHPLCEALISMLMRRWPGLRLTLIDGRAPLLDAVQQTCSSLAECSKRRAVVLTNDAAVTLCVANRFAHVRAAVCDSPKKLLSLMRELGPNLLLFDPDGASLRHLHGMIEQFAGGEIYLDPLVERALKSVGGSGAVSADAAVDGNGNEKARCACANR